MREIFDDIVNTAKQIMSVNGKHLPQAIIEANDGNLIMCMMDFSDDESKEASLRYLREFIHKGNIKRYFFVTEAWLSEVNPKNKMYRRASRDVDRKEVLMISEYRSDLTVKNLTCFFKRENDKIVFTEEKHTEGGDSVWNCYLELDDLNEKLDNVVKEVNENFIKEQSKKIADKYNDKFFSCKDAKERVVVINEMVKEMLQIKEEQMKTILEDVNEND